MKEEGALVQTVFPVNENPLFWSENLICWWNAKLYNSHCTKREYLFKEYFQVPKYIDVNSIPQIHCLFRQWIPSSGVHVGINISKS